MRDPGTPRRNPLFSVVDDDYDPYDNDDWGGDRHRSGAHAGAEEPKNPTTPLAESALNTLLAVYENGAEVIAALGEAQPEVVEHLQAAGRELIAAARVVLDATERALETAAAKADERNGSASAGAAARDNDGETDVDAAARAAAAASPAHPVYDTRVSRVRKIDLA
jgi:hypothetical protein